MKKNIKNQTKKYYYEQKLIHPYELIYEQITSLDEKEDVFHRLFF